MTDHMTETVTVALDVSKSAARLAAVRADELVDERTLPYEFDKIEQAIGRWPGARVCYRRDRPASGFIAT